MGYEIGVMKLSCDSMINRNDLDEVNNRFKEYTPMQLYRDLKEDISDFVKKEDVNILTRDMEFVQKDIGRLCTKEELMTRLNVFNADVNAKMQDRPTIGYFKKILGAYDRKIEYFNEALNEQMDKLDQTQADLDREIQGIIEEIERLKEDVGGKLGANEGARIWKEFQRFCLYQDLEDLNKRVLPEIANLNKN